jgi:site-specific DNA recombinase
MDKSLQAFQSFMHQKGTLEKTNRNGAVIYTRVSTKEQADNNASLETQKKYCEMYAAKRSLTVIDYFGGTHESAKSDERKEFMRMLKYVKKHKEIGYIIVYSYDRFSRTGSSGSMITEELKKEGILVCSTTQEVDASTSSGTFQQDLFFLFSKFDNDIRRDKTIAGVREKLRKGYVSGSIPFGYTNLNPGRGKNPDLIINQDGELLSRAFDLKFKHNWSNVRISDELKKLGWRKTYKELSIYFRNPFYCGVIVSSLIPGEIIEGKHPPVVSKDIFLRINNILAEQRASGYQYDSYEENLPLKQFVHATSCGTNYTGYLVKSRGRYYYKNNRIGSKENRSADKMHALFVELLSQYSLIDNVCIEPMKATMLEMFAELHSESIQSTIDLEKQLSKIESNLGMIERRFVLGEIDRELYLKYKGEFDQEMNQIKEEVNNCSFQLSNIEKAIEKAIDYALNLPLLWTSGNLDEKKKIQKMVFPDGIAYDFEKHHYRTIRVNQLFAAIPLLTRELSEKNKATSINFDDLSLLVARTRLERATFGL